jgi:hypothetical protein
MERNDNNDRPTIELFVKAAVDKMKNGGCPICHRYFLVFYILRERGLIDLVVTTFLPECPPKEVLEFSNGKHYPLIKVHNGVDSRGQDITGLECDAVDEIEALLDRFDCDDMRSRKESNGEAVAELSFEDLYMKFSQFLKMGGDSSSLVRILEKVEGHLREYGTRFMLGDNLTRADCYLLPTLQHIRVAGKAYKNFEIPTELVYIWRYLKAAYSTDAFQESCPADREIISHYSVKAASSPAVLHLPAGKCHLMGENRTFSIPNEASLTGNGYAD